MSGPCLLLDFAVYAPPDELRVNRVDFEKCSHKWAVSIRVRVSLPCGEAAGAGERGE